MAAPSASLGPSEVPRSLGPRLVFAVFPGPAFGVGPLAVSTAL